MSHGVKKCYGKYYETSFITLDRDCAICNVQSTCIAQSPVTDEEKEKAKKLDTGKRKLSLIHPSIVGIILHSEDRNLAKVGEAIYQLSVAAHAEDDGEFIASVYQALASLTKYAGSDCEALELMTVAMEYGANKPEYGRNNWKKGMEWSRLIDAAQRHGLAILKGEEVDKDSGNPHVAHMLASIHMLLGNHAMQIGTNDLY